jgi:hypothetical protein
MKRFSVICLQCGLNVDRLIDAETAQTEIHPVRDNNIRAFLTFMFSAGIASRAASSVRSASASWRQCSPFRQERLDAASRRSETIVSG